MPNLLIESKTGPRVGQLERATNVLKKLLKFTAAGIVGVYVSDQFVKPALKIANSDGFGMDDVTDGVCVAGSLLLVDRLF